LNISDTLKQYKTERIGTEDQLIKKIAKVNLDRTILFREKQNVLWQERSKLSQNLFEEELIKQKQDRYDINTSQKDAYNQMLMFIKARKAHPMEAEKQILDGLKVILDNGWVIATAELVEFFDSLKLSTRSSSLVKKTQFLEFMTMVS